MTMDDDDRNETRDDTGDETAGDGTANPTPSPDAPAPAPATTWFARTLAPITRPVSWNGHTNVVTFKILTGGEEREVTRYARRDAGGVETSQQYIVSATLARLAYALVAVDGDNVDDSCKDIDQRLEMVEDLSSPCIDALIEAYSRARDEPLVYLNEMERDAASFGVARAENGPSSARAASGTDAD